MSRRPRDGEAGKLVGIRASDTERERWEVAAKHAGADLSAWLRQAADELADTGKERARGWMRPASPVRTPGQSAPIRGNTVKTDRGSRRIPRR